MTDVLHCLHTFPPETKGGVQAHVERVARTQARGGEEVAIACATGDDEPRLDDWHGLAVRRLPALDPFEQLALDTESEKAER